MKRQLLVALVGLVLFLTVNAYAGSGTMAKWRKACAESSCEGSQELIEQVREAPINPNRKQPLIATLKAAAHSFESLRLRPGANQLRAFQYKVGAQLARNNPELAEALIRAAQDLIDGVELSVYDLSRDFSISSNPSGAWTYGYSTNLGSELIPFTLAKYNYDRAGTAVEVWAINSLEVPAVQRNNTSNVVVADGVFPPGTVWFYPGPSTIDGSAEGSESIAKQANFGVLRFTVPAAGAGRYFLRTAVRSAYAAPISGDTDFHVLYNGSEIFGQFLPAEGSAAFHARLTLAAGDTIDFVIGRGEDNSYHGSGLIIDATLFGAARRECN